MILINKKIAECISWAAHAGYVFADDAAIEYARETGTQAIRPDGLNGHLRFIQTNWERESGQGWTVKTNLGEKRNNADPTRVLTVNCFGVVTD